VQNLNEMFIFEIDSESENALVTVGSESSLSCDTGTLKRYSGSVPETQK
jgi:hypothetical protein